eukprot:1160783-Pelagomonas_calceolata.AAC.1
MPAVSCGNARAYFSLPSAMCVRRPAYFYTASNDKINDDDNGSFLEGSGYVVTDVSIPDNGASPCSCLLATGWQSDDDKFRETVLTDVPMSSSPIMGPINTFVYSFSRNCCDRQLCKGHRERERNKAG